MGKIIMHRKHIRGLCRREHPVQLQKCVELDLQQWRTYTIIVSTCTPNAPLQKWGQSEYKIGFQRVSIRVSIFEGKVWISKIISTLFSIKLVLFTITIPRVFFLLQSFDWDYFSGTYSQVWRLYLYEMYAWLMLASTMAHGNYVAAYF